MQLVNSLRPARRGADTDADAVLQHVRTHCFPASPGRRCFDGRYQPGQASGRIARPGADLGYVLAALAACRAGGSTVTGEEVADAVLAAVIEGGETFALHTDDATGLARTGETSRPVLGCRHVTAAIDPGFSSAYFPGEGDMTRDSAAAVARVLERWERGDRIDVVTLRGAPRDTDILINTGTRVTVEPGSAGYFVYDETRDRYYMMEKLAPRLAPHLGIGFDDLWSAAQRQFQTTLQVAVPGFMRWRVNADGPEPIVEPIGPVSAADDARARPLTSDN